MQQLDYVYITIFTITIKETYITVKNSIIFHYLSRVTNEKYIKVQKLSQRKNYHIAQYFLLERNLVTSWKNMYAD